MSKSRDFWIATDSSTTEAFLYDDLDSAQKRITSGFKRPEHWQDPQVIHVREVLPTPEPRLKLPDSLEVELFRAADKHAKSEGDNGNAGISFAEGARWQKDLDQAHFDTTVTDLVQVIEGLREALVKTNKEMDRLFRDAVYSQWWTPGQILESWKPMKKANAEVIAAADLALGKIHVD